MKLAILVATAAILAFPVTAQTTNDDTVATENWWDRVGAGFFSDATLDTPRPEYEIRAHWTGLSADDQAAIRTRCETGNAGEAASLQEGDEDESPDASATDLADQPSDKAAADGSEQTSANNATTTTGSAQGTETQRASPAAQPEPYTGLAGGVDASETKLVMICDLIRKL